MAAIKEMPQALFAEQSTWGAALIDHEAAALLFEKLESKDFNVSNHRALYNALRPYFHSGKSWDYVSIIEELQRLKKIDDCGGTAYLQTLIESCDSSALVGEHIKLVYEKSLARKLIRESEKVISAAYAGELPVTEQVESAGAVFFALGQSRHDNSGLVHAANDTDAVYAEIVRRTQNIGAPTGIPTGFPDYDDFTGGLHRGQLTIVAARPGMGKSAWATQVAASIATGGMTSHSPRYDALPVAFISLEMTRAQLIERMFSQIAGVDNEPMRGGYVNHEQLQYLNSARLLLRQSKLHIDETPGLNTFQIATRLRRMVSESGPLGLIVTDFLQLAKSPQGTENRVREIAEIAYGFADIAKQFDCSVLALSQLSRNVENREDKRPVLPDLEGGGALEQAAWVAAFIYRHSYYSKVKDDNSVEIIIGKQRGGKTGTIPMLWQGDRTRFVNLQK